MKSKKPPLVAVRYPAWSRYWQSVLPGLLDVVENGTPWRLQTEDNSYGEMESVRIDEHWRGDGAILFRATEAELLSYRKRGMAVVLTSTEGPDCGYPRVLPDNNEVGRLAAEHLLETGVQELAFLARGETLYAEELHASGKRVYASERWQGFRNRVRAEGLEARELLISGHPLWETDSWKRIQDETASLIRQLPTPCGLFVVDDALASVAVRAAEDAGRRIPDDLLLVSFGDDPRYCFAQSPALSSVPYPGRRIGHATAQLLERQLNGESCKGLVIRIPVGDVIQRKSSDALQVPDELVASVLFWVRAGAQSKPLHVAEVADHFAYSQSALNTRFRQVVGHSIKHEILRVRLHRLKHLLRTSDATLTQLGDLMGFTSPHELSRFFHRETGMRPVDWRARHAL